MRLKPVKEWAAFVKSRIEGINERIEKAEKDLERLQSQLRECQDLERACEAFATNPEVARWEEFDNRTGQEFMDKELQENRDWIYEEDGKTLTEEGLALGRYMRKANDLGIESTKSQWEYAAAMVELDLLNRIRSKQAETISKQTAMISQPSSPQVGSTMPSPSTN